MAEILQEEKFNQNWARFIVGRVHYLSWQVVSTPQKMFLRKSIKRNGEQLTSTVKKLSPIGVHSLTMWTKIGHQK